MPVGALIRVHLFNMVEFRLPERGRYMFHPHQHHMADAGAMGWFSAV